MLVKLRRKFIAYTVGIFGLIVLITIGGLSWSNYNQLSSMANQTMDSLLRTTNNVLPEVNSPFTKEKPPQPFNRNVFLLSNGELIGYHSTVSDETVIVDLSQIATEATGQVEYNGYKLWYKVDPSDSTRVAFVDMTVELSQFWNQVVNSVFIGMLALVAVFISSSLMASWALKPVESAWRKQKEFISDASHELRTPLAVISANAELLKDNATDTIATHIKWVDYIQEESKRMTELVERLLFLAKSDQQKQIAQFETLDLSNLVYETVLPIESLAFEQGKTFDLNINSNVQIIGDLSQIKQLVVILVDNALKYAFDKSTITVSLTQNGVLSVQNKGEVIPDDKIERLFERFYRVDESRTRKEHGYGLGLSIAQTIVQVHNARIIVTSDEKSGTIFSVHFQTIKGE